MIVTGARKGMGLAKKQSSIRSFWDELVYTRIVYWGEDFKGVTKYVITNIWEGIGIPVRDLLRRGYLAIKLDENECDLRPG